jgi:hypothetical protein
MYSIRHRVGAGFTTARGEPYFTHVGREKRKYDAALAILDQESFWSIRKNVKNVWRSMFEP